MEKITTIEISTYILSTYDIPLSSKEIFDIAKGVKKNIRGSDINTVLSRNSDNKNISPNYKKRPLFRHIKDNQDKYEIINKRDKDIIKKIDSYKLKMNLENKTHSYKEIFDFCYDLKMSDEQEFNKLFELLSVLK